jgi:branched-chain amino acid transport system substrate-binding protein
MERRQEPSIRVGMTAALTGRYSGPGRQALAGVQAWIADTNRTGGLWLRDRGGRQQLCLTYYDDASSAERCGALTERLIVEDQVDLLLGPYASVLTCRAAAVAYHYHRVLWNHGGAAEAVYTAGSGWVVGVLTPASRYFHGVLDLIRMVYPAARRVAMVHSSAGAFPKEVTTGAQQYCQERGFEVVGTYAYTPETVDFAPLFGQLASAQPDVLLGVGRIENDLRLATQWVNTDLTVIAVGLIVTPLALFRDVLGDAADGFLGPSQWEPGIITAPDYGPSSEEVIASLLAQGATGVDYPMAQAYAGCLVVQRCIEEAGSLDQQALRQVASRLDFTTFYGRYKIDPGSGRQLGHVMPVVQWRGGTKVVVWPLEMRTQSA